jgi:dipeptidyl aminopeptidase/acylaminoacyl peptidase
MKRLTTIAWLSVSILLLAGQPALAAEAGASLEPRPIVPTDLYRLKEVDAPAISPDGNWIAYQLAQEDAGKNATIANLWLVSWDGTRNRQLTRGEHDSQPAWSPDGRHLGFLASRQDSEASQLWLLDMNGGEARRITDVPEGVESYRWSPDGRKLVLIVRDPRPGKDSTDPDSTTEGAPATPEPIVVDRWHFKDDYVGYLDRRRTHLYVHDLETGQLAQVTSGDFDDQDPAWSPDGKRLAFARNGGPEIDLLQNLDVFVVDAEPGAQPQQLTRFPGRDMGPVWSPDGSRIAFLRGGDPKYSMYTHDRLAVIAPDGSGERVLTESLDRPASEPRWSPDGQSILFLLEDDRTVQLARVGLADGSIERLTQGPHVVAGFAAGATERIALVITSDSRPAEIAALENGQPRMLTRHNEPLIRDLSLATVEEFSTRTRDGSTVHGLALLPPGYDASRRYPTILYIHGGPFGQDDHAFDFGRQVFAAPGYVVLAVNFRGSSGRGEAYSKVLFADWGNKEVIDLLASVDHAVKRGWSDPERLFVGGWSYGGQLTNWLIASTPRFKAAVAGAGAGLYLSSYGIDLYTWMWESELGFPWENLDPWLKVSYPFLHADRITTPTLYMGGQIDYNMPIAGSEQMYQALRSLGVPTQLVVYPESYHWFSVPSHHVDMLNRHLAWWGKYGGVQPLPAAETGER